MSWHFSSATAYHRPGGVVPPTLLKQVRPNYTTEALRLRIEGVAYRLWACA